MMFSTKAEYGIRVMAHLAGRNGAEPISLGSIADAEGLPLAYLEHLVQRLRKAELVESRRGAHGGYSLARPAEDITRARSPRSSASAPTRTERSSASARVSPATIPAPRSFSGPACRAPSSAP